MLIDNNLLERIGIRERADVEKIKRSTDHDIELIKKHVVAAINAAEKNKAAMIAAVTADYSFLEHVDEDLKKDKDVVLAAVRNKGVQNEEYGRALEFAHETLQNDPEIVLIALQSYRDALKFAGKKLKVNKKFILEAIKIIGGSAFYFADEDLQKDRDLKIFLWNNKSIEKEGRADKGRTSTTIKTKGKTSTTIKTKRVGRRIKKY